MILPNRIVGSKAEVSESDELLSKQIINQVTSAFVTSNRLNNTNGEVHIVG